MARKYTIKSKDPGDTSFLDGLNPEQRIAAEHVTGPLLILAGAGSGKTRVMTHRIANLILNEGVWPNQILAMTFTNKAASEMRERVDALLTQRDDAREVTVSTFHSLCARLLRRNADAIGLTNRFVIYDEDDQLRLIRQVMEAEGMEKDRTEARRLRGYIESMKNQAMTPKQAHEDAHHQMAEDDAFFYEQYERRLQNANCVDFGGLILGMLEVFRENEDIAESYSRRWEFVMVDEFQDTNPAQYELLRHFTSTHRNLSVVGDDDQAIYRWRGATVRNILEFEEDYPDATVIKLEQNYRSSQTILDAAHDIIQHLHTRRPKTLWTDREGGDKIVCFTGSDEREEAVYVAGKVSETLRAGGDLSEVAVFYRTNAQGRAFEEQMRYAGLPYQIVGGMSFYAREEIKDVLAYLKVALNPRDEVGLLRILNKPTRGVGAKTIEKLLVAAGTGATTGIWGSIAHVASEQAPAAEPLSEGWLPGLGPSNHPELEELDALPPKSKKGVERFHEVVVWVREQLASADSLTPIVDELIQRINYMVWLEKADAERAEDRQRNVGELVSAIDEFETDPGSGAVGVGAEETLRLFLERSALIAVQDQLDDDEAAVTLMTVHASKGLEFESVYLAGMEDETFPSLRDESDLEELAEERRLAYVAITRAKHRLTITNARQRRKFGQIRYTSPSRFVMEIDPERLAIDPTSVTPMQRRRRAPFGTGSNVLGVNRSDWDFDQSATMVRNEVTDAVERIKELKQSQYDEFSQVDPYADDGYHNTDVVEAQPTGGLSKATKGATVSHTRYGVGEVVAVSGAGDMATLTVDFPTAGRKKIKRRWVKVL